MDACLIDVDKTKTEITPANGSAFTLLELYNILECDYIKIININKNIIMIVDEEG